MAPGVSLTHSLIDPLTSSLTHFLIYSLTSSSPRLSCLLCYNGAMPYVYVYQCDRCGYDVEISLSREFSLEADGSRVPYEYPQPDLYEWPVKRVSGLWNHLWCPGCRAVRPHVVVELDEP